MTGRTSSKIWAPIYFLTKSHSSNKKVKGILKKLKDLKSLTSIWKKKSKKPKKKKQSFKRAKDILTGKLKSKIPEEEEKSEPLSTVSNPYAEDIIFRNINQAFIPKTFVADLLCDED